MIGRTVFGVRSEIKSMSLSVRLAGISGVIGGLLWALTPTLDSIYPSYLKVTAIIPVLLIIASLGLAHLYRERTDTGELDTLAKAGFILLIGSLVLAEILTLTFVYSTTVTEIDIAMLIIGIPSVFTAILIGVGSGLIAYQLYQNKMAPRLVCLVFAIAIFIDPLVNAIVTPSISVGFSVYGIAWMLVGGFLMLSLSRNKA